MGYILKKLDLNLVERPIILVHFLELALRQIQTLFESIVHRLKILDVFNDTFLELLYLLVKRILLVQDCV